MSSDEFFASVQSDTDPPTGLTLELQSLWQACKGDWDRAHRIAQDIPSPAASWVHANLHREEGDIGNARYWYARAGKPESTDSVDDERKRIIEALLTP